MLRRVLVANRGEIACRVIRACHSLGIEAVAVCSDPDRDALHVAEADIAVPLPGSAPADTYANAAALVDAARSTGADAVHPGYGFLAENARFAQAVQDAGLVFVGPHPDTIALMGDKARAQAAAAAAGVPVLPGSGRVGPDEALDPGRLAALPFPVLVKASAGGGGIGMKVVERLEDLERTVAATAAQAGRLFGDPGVLIERYVRRARHVEVQVFGLGVGRAVHFFERDCSLQRRFQKVVEESPAPRLPTGIRNRMCAVAADLARAHAYEGAGTVEFLYDGDAEAFFFLEMNTRIQVEHPVTEAVLGLDLVALQLRQAGGEDLAGTLRQDDLEPNGHAVEVRLCAEDPAKGFRPSPGRLTRFDLPAAAPDIRVDTGFRAGDTVPPFYDSLLAKVIGTGPDRPAALAAAGRALSDVHVEGVATNRDLLRRILNHSAFTAGDVSTGFLAEHGAALLP